MIIRLSIKRLLKPILRMLITVAIILIIGFGYAGGFDSNLLPGFIIILCIPVLPTTYLCIEYLIASKNQTVEISDETLTIKYDNGKLIHYLIKDLAVLKLYKSKSMEKGSFPIQTAEMYYHATIVAKDGQKIILTSVLGPDFDKALDMLKGVELDITRTVYSTLYF
jgi:hypothetical protein